MLGDGRSHKGVRLVGILSLYLCILLIFRYEKSNFGEKRFGVRFPSLFGWSQPCSGVEKREERFGTTVKVKFAAVAVLLIRFRGSASLKMFPPEVS